MVLAADWGVGEVLWTFIYFTFLFIWIWLAISVFIDVFRSHDMNGWVKALWILFIIVLPFLGIFVYLIARGGKMQAHAVEAAKAAGRGGAGVHPPGRRHRQPGRRAAPPRRPQGARRHHRRRVRPDEGQGHRLTQVAPDPGPVPGSDLHLKHRDGSGRERATIFVVTPPEPSSYSAPSAADPWARAALSAELIGERLGGDFDVAVVLGSGLGAAAERLGDVSMSMADAGFPSTNVVGHAGTILAGTVGGARVLVLAGRVHLYEGHHPNAVVHGVRTAARLGCRRLLLTNAAGGIRPGLSVGDLVAISDHLNLTGANPLIGTHDLPHERFIDVSNLYPLAPTVAAAGGLETGVYAALPGPSYETPAEIRMLATLGADLVGMSTVLEALAAHALGVQVGGLSLVTNAAAGLGGELSHEEVTEVGASRAGAVVDTIAAVCEAIAADVAAEAAQAAAPAADRSPPRSHRRSWPAPSPSRSTARRGSCWPAASTTPC